MDGPSGPEPQSYNRAEIGPYYAQRSSCDDLPRPDYMRENLKICRKVDMFAPQNLLLKNRD